MVEKLCTTFSRISCLRLMQKVSSYHQDAFWRIDQIRWKNKILFLKGNKNKKASMNRLYRGKGPYGT